MGLYILFFVGAHAQELAEQYRKIKENKKANFKNDGLSKGEQNGNTNSQGSTNTKENNMADFKNGGLSSIEENCEFNSQKTNGVGEKHSNGVKHSGLKRINEKTDLFSNLDWLG